MWNLTSNSTTAKIQKVKIKKNERLGKQSQSFRSTSQQEMLLRGLSLLTNLTKNHRYGYFFFLFLLLKFCWIFNSPLVLCVCDFFSRTSSASGTRLYLWASKKLPKIPSACVRARECICVVCVCMCVRKSEATVYECVFGYHFSFLCAIIRSRGSSLDKNQNISSVDHMCSLLPRA